MALMMARANRDAPKDQGKRKLQARVIVRLGLAMVILGVVWRVVRYCLGFPLWGDEAFIVTSLYERGFGGMVGALEHNQAAPLGFMWAELAVSRLLGMSEWALRVPALVCGLFSLILFRQFSSRILDKRSALLAMGIMAASYYVVRHSAEVKPYAGDLAVSLVISWLGWEVYGQGRCLWRWVLLIVATGAGVWLSYPAVFVGGSVFLLLCLKVRREKSRGAVFGLTLFGLVLCVSFWAMYVFQAGPQFEAASHMTNGRTWSGAFPPLTEPWRVGLWLLDVHTGNMMAYPLGGKRGGSVLTFVLVAVGVVSLWRSRRRDLLLLLIGPVVLGLIAAAMRKYPYGTSARVAQHLAPAFCLLAGVGLAGLLRRMLKDRALWGMYIATAVFATIAISGTVVDIVRPQKKLSDQLNRQEVRGLGRATSSNDQWVIFNALAAVDYAPDMRKWGGSGARFRYYVRRFGPAAVRWGVAAEEVARSNAGNTWLLVYTDNKQPFDRDQLESYLITVKDHLGEPAFRRIKLDSAEDGPERYEETIEVYKFGPLADGGGRL